MKDIIYVVNTNDGEAPDWLNYTLGSIQQYSRKVDAQLDTIQDESLYHINYPLSFFKTKRSYYSLLKIHCLQKFITSEYNNCLILDRDIYIQDDAVNVFTYGKYSNPGMYCRVCRCKPLIAKTRDILDRTNTSRPKGPINRNSGMIYIDRPTAVQLCKHLPADGQWDAYVKGLKIEDLVTIGGDQPIINYARIKAKIPFRSLSKSHNVNWKRRTQSNDQFIHYPGYSGKESLLESVSG